MVKPFKTLILLTFFSTAILFSLGTQAKTTPQKLTVTIKYQYKNAKNMTVTKSKKYKVNKNSYFLLKYSQLPKISGWERVGVKKFKVTKNTTKIVKYKKWLPKVAVTVKYYYRDNYSNDTVRSFKTFYIKKGATFSLNYTDMPLVKGYERKGLPAFKATKNVTKYVRYLEYFHTKVPRGTMYIDSKGYYRGIEKFMLGEINHLRAQNGKVPYKLDKPLMSFAAIRTNEMLYQTGFTHDRPSGTFHTEGLPIPDELYWSTYSYIGENICSLTTIPLNKPQEFPAYLIEDLMKKNIRQALERYMNSTAGHRETLLSDTFDKVGFSLQQSNKNIAYNSINFAGTWVPK